MDGWMFRVCADTSILGLTLMQHALFFIIAKWQKQKKWRTQLRQLKGQLAKMAAANSLATLSQWEILSSGVRSGVNFYEYGDRKGIDKANSVCKVCKYDAGRCCYVCCFIKLLLISYYGMIFAFDITLWTGIWSSDLRNVLSGTDW